MKKFSPMWSAIFGRKEKERDAALLLRQVPVFSGLSRRELAMLVEIGHRRTYESGEYIFRKGQEGDALYLIESGQVQVVTGPPSDEKVLAYLGPGNFFGELALLDDSPRSASARAETETDLYAFFRVDLEEFLAGFPQTGLQVYRGLAHVIGERLRAMNEQLLING